MWHRLLTLMNETQVKGERAAHARLMLIRRTHLQRKHLLLPAAIRHSSRLINRWTKASLIHPLDSIADTEVEVKTYGTAWLHGNQWDEDWKSNSYLQLHLHGVDAHHFVLEERMSIRSPIQKEGEHVTVWCWNSQLYSASGANCHLDAQLPTVRPDLENFNKWTAKTPFYFFNVVSTMSLQMLKHSFYNYWAHCFRVLHHLPPPLRLPGSSSEHEHTRMDPTLFPVLKGWQQSD